MFDIGWTELLVVGVVALVVVGPKDLPKMFRTVGQFTGKARAMAREFTRAMDAAADEAGVKDLRDTVSGRKLREATGLDEVEKELSELSRVERWEARKPAAAAKGNLATNDPGAVAEDDPEARADAAFEEAESAVAKLRAERQAKRAEAQARAEAIRTGTTAPAAPAAVEPAPKVRKPRAPRKTKPAETAQDTGQDSGPET